MMRMSVPSSMTITKQVEAANAVSIYPLTHHFPFNAPFVIHLHVFGDCGVALL